MQNINSALVAGATGMVGSELIHLLKKSGPYREVILLVRKTQNTGATDNGPVKIKEIETDFDNLEGLEQSMQISDAFCCLGTTMKKAGSKEAFYKVDFTYVHDFAKFALDRGAKRFFLVSSLGADSSSLIFYNKVKGEIEDKVKGMPFESVHIFQPSLLLGDRKEKRMGEDIGRFFDKVLSPIIPKKYKGIQANTVARAMVSKTKENTLGAYTYTSDKIRDMV